MNKTARKVVSQIAGRKYKSLFVMMWVTLALYIGVPIVMGILGAEDALEVFVPICGFSGVAFIIITVCYFTKMNAIKKSVKTLDRTNKLDFSNEIVIGDYNTDGKMGFSKHLLYDRKTNAIVAYDDIIWIYKKAKNRYTTETLFCTIDGKKHSSIIDDPTLNEFLKRRSGIMVGYTPQNKTIYKMKVNEFKSKKNIG